MTFGTEWGWGADRDESQAIFTAYAEAGGNFIDTADFYTGGTSERWTGAFIKNDRDRFVLGTKFTVNTRPGDPNAGGNHRKNLVASLESSLRRLGTDRIDVYWVHVWDSTTPVEEVMRALDDQVRLGKILYVAASDYPSWKVAEANAIALLRGWTPFIALQSLYNLISRDAERDLIPMTIDQRMGFIPWSPLARGLLGGKYTRADLQKLDSVPDDGTRRRQLVEEGDLTDRNIAIIEALFSVAERLHASPAQVALRWLLQKPGVSSVIVGARTSAQLVDNLASTSLELDSEAMDVLNNATAIDLGFPQAFVSDPNIHALIRGTLQ